MSVVNALKYRYDGTAANPSNYIVDELHEVSATTAYIIVANHGLMYTPGLILRAEGVSVPLLLGTDYDFYSIDADITLATGIETATAIHITNPGVYSKVLLTYQAVGGVEGRSNQLIMDLRATIDAVKTTSVSFNNLTEIPGGFTPEDHTHPLSQITHLNPLRDSVLGLQQSLVESRPLNLAGLALKEQDSRTIKIMGRLREDMSQMFSAIHACVEENVKLTARVIAAEESLAAHLANHPVTTVYTTETVTTVVEADGSSTVTTDTVETSDNTVETVTDNTTTDTTDSTDSTSSDSTDSTDSTSTDSTSTDTTSGTAEVVSGDDILVEAGVDDTVVADTATESDSSSVISDDSVVVDTTDSTDDSSGDSTDSGDVTDSSSVIGGFPFVDSDIVNCLPIDPNRAPPVYPDTIYVGPVDCGVL